MKTEENLIIKFTLDFAISTIEYFELLEINKKFIIANQLHRSGTSIGANVREAQNAESKADFFHKIKIALKEVEETEYWIELCTISKNYPNPDNLSESILSIKKILSKIIITSKQR